MHLLSIGEKNSGVRSIGLAILGVWHAYRPVPGDLSSGIAHCMIVTFERTCMESMYSAAIDSIYFFDLCFWLACTRKIACRDPSLVLKYTRKACGTTTETLAGLAASLLYILEIPYCLGDTTFLHCNLFSFEFRDVGNSKFDSHAKMSDKIVLARFCKRAVAASPHKTARIRTF
jgi:hypothetical protein